MWSLTDESGNPTDVGEITSYGLINPKKNGTVIARAAAVDGSGKSAEEFITITNQDLENIALNKSAYATTNSNEANKAIDGDRSTRWGSARSAPQNSHFTVDLQGEYIISSMALYFESALPTDFVLQYSEDGAAWEDIQSVTGNAEQNLRYSFEPLKARYLRIQAMKTTNQEWGFSIWEFEAYGNLAEVNKDALLSLYNTVKDLKEEDYTADSFAPFKLALEEAQNILALEEATEEEVDKALEDLSLARDGLVLVTPNNPSLSPARLTFYKNKESQEDIKTNIIWNDATKLTDIKQDGDSIGSENYVVSGSSLTIKKEYLDGLAEGEHILKAEFDNGDAADLYITILDAAVPEISAVIHPTSTRFDKKAGNQADISLTITLNDASKVMDIKMDGKSVEKRDYEVNGSKLIIKKEYLRNLTLGNHILSVGFDKGNPAYVNVTIVNTTSSSSNGGNHIPTPVKTEPEIIGGNGATGWKAIIKNMPVPAEEEKEPNQVAINMNQSRILPKEFLTFLKGKNIIVKLFES